MIRFNLDNAKELKIKVRRGNSYWLNVVVTAGLSGEPYDFTGCVA